MKRQKLTITEAKIIKGKLEHKTSQQIADDIGLTGTHAAATVRRHIQKPTLQAALTAELIKQGLTLETIVKPVAKAINATTSKQVGTRVLEYDEKGRPIETEYIYEEVDNLPLQMQAADRASKWLGLDKAAESGTGEGGTGLSPEDLKALAAESDEMTLTQLVFKKS
jgi:hypothetical protein